MSVLNFQEDPSHAFETFTVVVFLRDLPKK